MARQLTDYNQTATTQGGYRAQGFPMSQPSGDTLASNVGSGSMMGSLFNVGSSYLLGQQGQEAFAGLGQDALAGAERLGNQAVEGSQFRPFTVTSNLANVQTTPEGGFNVNLSPEQQALQSQLMGQAGTLFGQVGQDPSQQAAGIYDQIRATQRPEEERNRLAMQEGLFASGRGGLQTAQFGGSPEQFAFEKARAEAQAGASLNARQQALAEQQQSLSSATGLLGAGYSPQQRALESLGFGTDISNLVGTSNRAGSSLQAQLGQTGLEGYLQAAELGQNERLASLQSMANTVGGTGGASGLLGGLDQFLPSWMTGGSSNPFNITAGSLGLDPSNVYYQDPRASDNFGFENGATGDYDY